MKVQELISHLTRWGQEDEVHIKDGGNVVDVQKLEDGKLHLVAEDTQSKDTPNEQ